MDVFTECLIIEKVTLNPIMLHGNYKDNIIEILTQPDRHPEYYTQIFVKCSCGKSVEFCLPVN